MSSNLGSKHRVKSMAISQAALMDMATEIALPGTSLALDGSAGPALTCRSEWRTVIRESKAQTSRHSNKGFTEAGQHEDEEHGRRVGTMVYTPVPSGSRLGAPARTNEVGCLQNGAKTGSKNKPYLL
ncbi:hypothetical protein MJO29_012609 [Puccinia striiformis f. sp. tritici]|uniref:Uncharacterized protein n=1 Tax=Puccinia striiformis TaxID=27350 RepID=A0A2S4WH45_9BASI|nr:hypothetical protein MJO29_012609 [Puccinia striiformis f. sp. tritici]KAI9599811.1 hypothetical protein KEM48_006340 [Puccinia striiformis f. sp. tritici PST-130]POW21027.1 hypothetical protein PSHT_02930 [Puccinia striiformis]